jgi:hypothetical protein
MDSQVLERVIDYIANSNISNIIETFLQDMQDRKRQDMKDSFLINPSYPAACDLAYPVKIVNFDRALP